MGDSQRLTADLVWTGDQFERDVVITVTDGTVIALDPAADTGTPHQTLTGRALLPGFVNAHSHAFQRGLRGHGETFPAGAGSFWTWREAMYGLVQGLDAKGFRTVCRRAFREMLAAGITTVGEFHYFHHLTDRGHPFDADSLVLEAAAEVGLRIVLLQAFYKTGGIGEPLQGGQRHFETPSLDAYWDQYDRLAERLTPATQSLGVVGHSIRALGIDDLVALHAQARRRGLVFHMHVEEQRQEIDACREAYGLAPMALLHDRLDIDHGFTAVHCTHTAPDDMARFLAAGGNVCICPLTEANLADGIADLPGILRGSGGGPGEGFGVCLGTDSNLRISMQEEIRWLEYVQRLAREQRGICRDDQGRVGPRLLDAATVAGARALGLPTGKIAPGHHADFIAIDLAHPSLEGADDHTLLDAFLYGADKAAIADVCVGGHWLF